MDRIYNMLNLNNMMGLLGSKAGAVVEFINTWFYFSSTGANPKTWEDMETAGPFQRKWEDLV